jgi:hypothetical protein
MITTNENIGNDDLNYQTQGSGSTSFGVPDNGNPNSGFSDDASEDDLESDDELLDDDLDSEDEYDEANLDDTEGGGTTTTGGYAGGDSGFSSDENPDEIPEESESTTEGTGYSGQPEQSQQEGGSDASFSEQIDVTPPSQHEFPSTGTATETDFTSRSHGRTTGRMLGHEPGTEGI